MAFVEFEDVSSATKALTELYGAPLHNSVKGGIRLSFAKNPLVRDVKSSGLLDQSLPSLFFPPETRPEQSGGSDARDTKFEFGIDPSADPELALALRMSMQEEQDRLDREGPALDSIVPKRRLGPGGKIRPTKALFDALSKTKPAP